MGNCNNCDCNEADRLREFDDNVNLLHNNYSYQKIEPMPEMTGQYIKRNDSQKSLTQP